MFSVDLGTIFSAVILMFNAVKQLVDFLKSGLDTAKNAKEIFESGQELLAKSDKDDKAIERVRSVADLLRSYALFGLLEYLYKTTLAAMMLYVLTQGFKSYESRRKSS